MNRKQTSRSQPKASAKRKRFGKGLQMMLIGVGATCFCVGFAVGFLIAPVKNGILSGNQNYFTYPDDGNGKLPEAIAAAMVRSGSVTVVPESELPCPEE